MSSYWLIFWTAFIGLTRAEPAYTFNSDDVIIVEVDMFTIEHQSYEGMVIYPFIFIQKGLSDQEKADLLAHEYAHVIQQRRDGILFWANYGFFFLRNFQDNYFKCKSDKCFQDSWSQSYWDIPYEKEARQIEQEEINSR